MRKIVLLAVMLCVAATSIIVYAWNPPTATEHLTLSWNYTGETLQPLNLVPVAFALTFDYQAFNFINFSFEIWVVAQSL
jgi:hypothetical protein